MKCDIHVDNETIGICGYCGRAVCEECRVRVFERIFCSDCAADGRIMRPFPQLRPPGQGPATEAQLLKDFEMMAAARHGDYIEPSPIGEPRESLFKTGGQGALLGCVVSILQGINLVLVISMSSLDLSAVCLFLPLTVLGILFAVSILMVCTGLYGFYWNYGVRRPFHVSPAAVTGAVLFLILWHTFAAMSLNTIDNAYYVYMWPIAMYMLGISVIAAGYGVLPVKYFIPMDNPIRASVEPAGISLIIGGVLAFASGGVQMSMVMSDTYNVMSYVVLNVMAWFAVAIGMTLLAIVFPRAPVPTSGPSEAPTAKKDRPRKVRYSAKRSRML